MKSHFRTSTLPFFMAALFITFGAAFCCYTEYANGQPPTPIEVVEDVPPRIKIELVPRLATVGIVLAAPDICEVGELVRFDATSSDVDSLTWDILPPTPDFEVVDRRAFFSARNSGEWLVILAGAKNGQSFLSHKKIVVSIKKSVPKLTSKPTGKFKQLVDRLENEQ